MKLTRFSYTPDATFGRLEYAQSAGQPIMQLWTVEPPWQDNTPFKSCIPLGTYPTRPCWFVRGKYTTWEVCDVPGRWAILIHKGNRGSHFQGCIGVGHSYSNGGVWQSAEALDELLTALPPTKPGPDLEIVEDLRMFGPESPASVLD